MSFMVIAVAMLAAFCLQFLFQMVQMKSFNMFAIDQDGVIIDGCFMRGFTMLARFKNWDFFNGIDVGTIKKDDCATIGVSLRRAVLNASSNYNTIMSGGEVLEKPSLFTRIGDKIYGVNKKKA